jgi:glucose-6-phosphate 1-epimerase
MENPGIPERLRQFEIPGRVTLATGHGGRPKINITAGQSAAEIYLHGAHVTGFQKNGEPPLLFMSRLSRFAAGQPIRGGVPICFPWFGPREGNVVHGFARITEWELAAAGAVPAGGVTLRFRLPPIAAGDAWPPFDTEFAVTVADQLTMELITTNKSADKILEFENCLHAYFAVGDIAQVSIAGLQGVPFLDYAAGAGGARREGDGARFRFTKETNRVYPDSTGVVEIHDESLQRTIRVEKFNSRSTVVWNPWTTQKMPDDFDSAEYQRMVCVESGNVKQNKLSLSPGQTAALKMVLSSQPF